VSPKSVSGSSAEDTGEWKVLWPPNIPGLLQHPPAKIPTELPIEVDKRLEALSWEDPEHGEKFLQILAESWHLDIDTNTEAVVQKLEEHHLRSGAILKRLTPERALDYLHNVRAPGMARDYAKSVLAEDPQNVEARLELARYMYRLEAPEAAIAEYRAILDIDPHSVRAMTGLGAALHYNHPEEAIAVLKKALALGSPGDYNIGLAYERLGDYKNAWVHYHKALTRDPDGDMIYMHMKMIVEGDPFYPRIQRPKNAPSLGAASDTGTPSPTGAGVSVSTPDTITAEAPVWEPTSTGSQHTEMTDPAQAAAAARAQQQQLQREIEDFIHWLEQAENETPDAEDFLSQEMQKHLRGSAPPEFAPDRLIRAQEALDRYGHEEGMRRLERTDPKIAERVRQNPPRPRHGASPPRSRK